MTWSGWWPSCAGRCGWTRCGKLPGVMAESEASEVDGAGLLEYQRPERALDWLIRAEGGRVTLSVAGPPAWWQLTSATVGVFVWGTLAAAALATAINVVGVPAWSPSAGIFLGLMAIVCGVLTFRDGSALRRRLRHGPDREGCDLTSEALRGCIDPVMPIGPRRRADRVLCVSDVVAAPGRLLYNGRRELLLRLLLTDGSLDHVIWRASRTELEACVDELRKALRLDS